MSSRNYQQIPATPEGTTVIARNKDELGSFEPVLASGPHARSLVERKTPLIVGPQ
ncbi:hypothetical protein J6590_017403, partial [Homalodisca vitripennis]